MIYPEMYGCSVVLPGEREADVLAAVRRELRKIFARTSVKPAARVGITAGSRGIRNLAAIARILVDDLKDRGARPFIFPAMGSHGGGTAAGQAAVLGHYGITEAAMGCPVLSSMETVRVGNSAEGIPQFLDRHAFEADHVVVMNRVKEHTEFKGAIESGLIKMMLIGMGKNEGARIYHRAFADYGFDRIAGSLANVVIAKARVLYGLAIIENGYEETALIRGLLPQEIVPAEQTLLLKAKDLAPRLPFDDVDILVVDEMGKNISGAGMDTNVIGRFYNAVAREPDRPRIKRIYVRSLTEESMGNAIGVGLADFVHRDLAEKIDFSAMNTNALTSSNPEKARVPIICSTDREALDLCLGTIGLAPREQARLIRVRNTLHLTEIDISQSLAAQIRDREDLKITAGPAPLNFDACGNLFPMLGLGNQIVHP